MHTRISSRAVASLAAAAVFAAACTSRRTDPSMAAFPDGSPNPSSALSSPVEYLLTELGPTAVPTSGSEPSLRLDEATRRFSGFSGCNRFNGAFVREGDGLRFGPLAMTRMACSDPLLTQLEIRFTQAISQTSSLARVGENTIELRDVNGTTVARLRRR